MQIISDGIVFEFEHPGAPLVAIGSKGDRYDVDMLAMTCTCKSFKYRKDLQQMCRHLIAAVNGNLT